MGKGLYPFKGLVYNKLNILTVIKKPAVRNAVIVNIIDPIIKI